MLAEYANKFIGTILFYLAAAGLGLISLGIPLLLGASALATVLFIFGACAEFLKVGSANFGAKELRFVFKRSIKWSALASVIFFIYVLLTDKAIHP